ncbi:uncharacterized protein BXZ73DRAFT_101974 [Epithele typhae]|uniref:uncharacterized protein n=1 Tax=Epithele typhae TaxID=378194 RepID=UPI002007F48D|nr:uncharacterized protein BXZ73DRAFT_101974 [Epithele typhae]KAH9929912.1 hypothetical protein BXZ73DRAFT_101974 [Epithele typhae]
MATQGLFPVVILEHDGGGSAGSVKGVTSFAAQSKPALGIALAANIGGQRGSPISSPQNLIALDWMDPKLDRGSWFAVSIAVSVISIVLVWLLLLVSYRPARSPTSDGEIAIKPVRAPKEHGHGKQWWVTFVCLVTISLWCVAHSIEGVLGDMGVIAIILIVVFFLTGVLKKDDFGQFL